jgi:hypothetical protein
MESKRLSAMRTDRPLSEHEGALFDALRVLGVTVLELGADPDKLRDRLTDEMRRTEGLGNHNGAATLGFLITAMFGGPDPEPRPSLRIV